MLHSSKTVAALLVVAIYALPAGAQTATGTGTTAGTGGGGAGVNLTSGGGSAASTAVTDSGYTADITTGFSGGVGATTMTNTGAGAIGGGGAGGKGGTTASTYVAPATGYGLNAYIVPTYGNPLGLGTKLMGSSTLAGGKGVTAAAGSTAFGVPMYTSTTTSISTTGKGMTATNTTKTNNGFSNTNISRVPRYYAALSPDFPLAPRPTLGQIQPDLQRIIAQTTSPKLKNRDSIQVVAEGNTVVLVGQVGSASEREFAARLLLLDLRGRPLDNRLVVMNQP